MITVTYQALTDMVGVIGHSAKAAEIASSVLVDIAQSWKDDVEFERKALADTRRDALNKAIEEKKKRLSGKTS